MTGIEHINHTVGGEWSDEGNAAFLLGLSGILSERQPWRAQAACAGMDPNLFFPENANGSPQALAVCRGCPARAECLEDNLDEAWGTWGGTSQNERQRIRNRRARGAA